jgi:hypothetical protein
MNKSDITPDCIQHFRIKAYEDVLEKQRVLTFALSKIEEEFKSLSKSDPLDPRRFPFVFDPVSGEARVQPGANLYDCRSVASLIAKYSGNSVIFKFNDQIYEESP